MGFISADVITMDCQRHSFLTSRLSYGKSWQNQYFDRLQQHSLDITYTRQILTDHVEEIGTGGIRQQEHV